MIKTTDLPEGIKDNLLSQFLDHFKNVLLPSLTSDPKSPGFIDLVSCQICEVFQKRYDMTRNDYGQRIAYEWIFDCIGTIEKWYKLVRSRCDAGKCTLGPFAMRLIDNKEIIWFPVWWKNHGHRYFQKKHPGVFLAYEYNGVEKSPHVIFFPGDRSQPDFRIMNAVTKEVLDYVEFKADARDGRGTYKLPDLEGYWQCFLTTKIPVYMVTLFYKGKKSNYLYFSIIDHNGIEAMLSKKLADNETIVENCFAKVPWFASGEKLCTVLGDGEYQNLTTLGSHQIRRFAQFGEMYDYLTGELLDEHYEPKGLNV